MITVRPALALALVPSFRPGIKFIGEEPGIAYPEHTAPSGDLHDPVHGGVYVQPQGANWIGTLAGIVNKGTTPVLLSNAHVFYTHSGCCAGRIIYEPPISSTKSRKIGVTQTRHKPGNVTFKNGAAPTKSQIAAMGTYYDAGLSTLTVRYSYNIDGIGVPTGHVAAKAGMKVMMSGATQGKAGTRVTKGTITKASVNITVDYGDGTYDYAKDVFQHTCVTDHGDSGAMVLEQGTKKVVGLTFAGGGGSSYAVKATTIANALGINFVGKAGTFPPPGGGPTCTKTCDPGYHLDSASCSCVKNTCTQTCTPPRILNPVACVCQDKPYTPPSGGSGNDIVSFLQKNPGVVVAGGGLLLLLVVAR